MTDRERITMPPSRSASDRLVDAGSAIGCGLGAALLGAGPAALRLADASGDDGTRAWLLLAACATPFTTLAVVVLREAMVGLRAYVAEAPGQMRLFVALWFGVSSFLLDKLGAILRAHTHHHPLAGVTFALAGVTVLVVSGVFTRRLARVVHTLRGRGYVATYAIVSTIAYALVAAMLLAAAHALQTRLLPESAAAIVDVTALALASALAARPELRPVRALAILGPVAAIALVAVGLARCSAEWAVLVTQRAPAFGVLLHALGRGPGLG